MLRILQRTTSFKRSHGLLPSLTQSSGKRCQIAHARLVQFTPPARPTASLLARGIHSEISKTPVMTKLTAKIVSQPPLPVRLALVGTTVMLATPVFTVAGIYRIWTASSLLPTVAKRVVTVLIGGSTFTLFYTYIIPNILDYSNILLPFALSNGIACMAWHGVAEAVLGVSALATLSFVQFQGQHAFLQQSGLLNRLLKGVAHMPVGGAIIGVLAALTAPLLWPAATHLCWEPDLRTFLLGGDELTWLMDAYFKVVIPVGIPVGFVSGLSLHQVLQPVVLGVEGTAWYTLSLPALAGVSLLCVLLYRTLLPGGSARSSEEMLWVRRLDPVTGRAVSLNLATKELAKTHDRARKAEMQMAAVEMFHFLRRCGAELREMWSSDTIEQLWFDDLPSYRSDTTYKLQEIAEVENLYKLIDILVRHKHLDQQEQRHAQTSEGTGADRLAAARASLEQEAAEALHILDVPGLYRDVEKLCILRKSLAKSAASSSSSSSDAKGQKARALMAKEVGAKLLAHRPSSLKTSSFSLFGGNAQSQKHFERSVHTRCEKDSPPPVKGHRAISVLSHDSLGLLEDELADKLHYIIPLKEGAEAEEFLSKHRHEKRMEAWQQGLMYLIPVLGCWALLSLN